MAIFIIIVPSFPLDSLHKQNVCFFQCLNIYFCVVFDISKSCYIPGELFSVTFPSPRGVSLSIDAIMTSSCVTWCTLLRITLHVCYHSKYFVILNVYFSKVNSYHVIEIIRYKGTRVI